MSATLGSDAIDAVEGPVLSWSVAQDRRWGSQEPHNIHSFRNEAAKTRAGTNFEEDLGWIAKRSSPKKSEIEALCVRAGAFLFVRRLGFPGGDRRAGKTS